MTAMADKPNGGKGAKGKHQGDRKEWMQKMKEYKHAYLIKELDLSEKQAVDFFKAYDAREQERFDAESKVRKLERAIEKKGDKATDEELDECIAAQYQLNKDMVKLDEKYKKTFRKLLTKRQLYKLPHAEREFQRTLMEKRKDCPPPPPQK